MSEEKKELTKKEIYEQIEDLTKKGKTTAEIGLILKQKYGVKSVLQATGKKIGKVQAELDLKKDKLPDELLYLIKKSVKLIKHKENNKKDTSAKRGYQKTVSKINRLRKYNIKKKRIDGAWRYSDDSAKLLVK
ncbi:MAG TPA: 30S ribosomal protein S15 [archaeon]|jgi:small subunit ribosomal protein S15|nr:30S ribosomal protein S15 [archaeon]